MCVSVQYSRAMSGSPFLPLVLQPEVANAAEEKCAVFEDAARRYGLDRNAAASFLNTLVGLGAVVLREPDPKPSQTRRLVQMVETSSSEEEDEQESPGAQFHVQVYTGLINGVEQFVMPTTRRKDGTPSRGIWFYTFEDLKKDNCEEVVKDDDLGHLKRIFEGVPDAPRALARSNHEQAFSRADLKDWKTVTCSEVAMYDAGTQQLVMVVHDTVECRRARVRGRAFDMYKAILQRGWGHNAKRWEEQIEKRSPSPFVFAECRPFKGVCGACGSTRYMCEFVLDVPEDMKYVGSYCAIFLNIAPRLRSYAVLNNGDDAKAEDLIQYAGNVLARLPPQ
jgi:hypothetical protein